MGNRERLLPLVAATALSALAVSVSAQAIAGPESQELRQWTWGDQPMLNHPVGPEGRVAHKVDPTGRVVDWSQSAILNPLPAPPGGFKNLLPNIRGQVPPPSNQGDGGSRYVDQPINCAGDGWFSNNNSNRSPYLVFDDFVADGAPLRNVEFYGGVYGGSFDLSAIQQIGMEIWTISDGGACGWVYDSRVNFYAFTLDQLTPTFECNVNNGLYDAYKFTATLPDPLALTAGENYMITIYATLWNPDGSELFVWSDTLDPHYNQATSWNRSTFEYARCSPDMAFRTNANTDTGSCWKKDCNQTCYYSNYFSNTNPYISLDDFTAPSTGDLTRIQATCGVWDVGNGAGTDFSNISGLFIEIYDAVPSGDFPCGNYVGGFYGNHVVALSDTNARYDCTDIHGIAQYKFTIEMPAGFPLVAGQRYMLGVYGVPIDPNSDNLLCWGGTDAIYGFTSWSYNLSTGTQEICHDVDQAFCIDPRRPCFADFNNDGVVDTRDVLAFLNAWSSGNLTADMDYNVKIDTRDVLAFLNIWTAGC